MIRARIVQFVTLALLTAAVGLFAGQASAADVYVVTAETASLGRTPSNAAERLDTLPLGQRVELVGPGGGEWLHVSARDGRLTGYIHTSTAIPEAEATLRAREMFRLAYSAMRASLYPEAAGHFAVGLALDPNDGVANFYAGETALVLGQKSEAIRLFRNARRLAPGTGEANHAEARLAQLGSAEPAPTTNTESTGAVRVYVVTAKIANVRAGPSTAHEANEWIKRGARITASVAAESADWLRIERDGRTTGYLHRSLAVPESEADGRGRTLVAEASAAIDGGRHEEAAKLLEERLALDPNDARANFLAGEAHFALGDREQAKSFYEAARRLATGSEQQSRAIARLAEIEDTAPAARTGGQAAAIAAGPPANVPRDLRTGADLFDRALRTTKDIPGLADRYFAALTVARLQAKAGWHAAARDTFGQIIAAAPAFEDVNPGATQLRRVWALSGAADIQCLAGYPKEARTTRARAAALADGNAALLAIVIGSQQRCGQAEDVRRTLAAIEKQHQDAPAAALDEFRYNFAAALSDEGVFDAALSRARAVGNLPWKAFALAGVALEMRRFGRFDEAGPVFDEAAGILPADSPQSGPLKERIDEARDDPDLLPEAIGNLLRHARFAVARGDLASANADTSAAIAALDRAKKAGSIAADRMGIATADLVGQLVELDRIDEARKLSTAIDDAAFAELAEARIAAGLARAGDPAAAERTVSKLKGDARVTALVGIAIGYGRGGDIAAGRAAAEKAVALIDKIESQETRAGLYAETAVAYFALTP